MDNQLLDTPIDQRSQTEALPLGYIAYQELVKYASSLFSLAYTPDRVKAKIMERGHSEEIAERVIEDARKVEEKTDKGHATRDIIIGGLFLFGGLIGTFANTGFIFWGAIVFGGIQFVKGLIALSN